MDKYSLSSLARKMKQLDFCMLVTTSRRGPLNSRPMSNNGDVTYNGHSYFFTYEDSQKVKDMEFNPQVVLNFETRSGLFISVSGKAKLIRQKAQFEQHWMDELQRWFPDGTDTEGMVLIHVKGSRLRYWDKEKEGTLPLK